MVGSEPRERKVTKNNPIAAPTTTTVKKKKTRRKKMLVVRSSETVSGFIRSYCSLLISPSAAQSFSSVRARSVSSLSAV